jgi:Domain of unknown function (DUF4082)
MATYTLFNQAATGASLTVDPVAYTMGVQFKVTLPGFSLAAVWFYSAATATVLPQTIALYDFLGSANLIHSESATWSGAPGSGWVRAAFASPPALTAAPTIDIYKACVLQNSTVNWYSATSHYWDTGSGSGGITSGPMNAPNNAGSHDGQDSFAASAILSYPSGSFNATNYWVDPEITDFFPPPLVSQRSGLY